MRSVVAWAAEPYILLEPVPATGDSVSNYADYYRGAYSTILTLVVVLAVIMVVVGGIQYTASSMNPALKSEAKTRIGSAIGGLLLALFSWLILQTINPDILGNSNVLVSDSVITSGAGGSVGGGLGFGTNCGGRGRCGGPTNITDDQGRIKLVGAGVSSFDSRDGGIPDCETNGFASPCGYFQGVQDSLVAYVDGFSSRCNCTLVARDATGPGHSEAGHYDGEKIDFAPKDSLNSFVMNNPSQFRHVGDINKIDEGQTVVWQVYEDKTASARWTFEHYAKQGRDHWDVDINVK